VALHLGLTSHADENGNDSSKEDIVLGVVLGKQVQQAFEQNRLTSLNRLRILKTATI